MNPTGSKSRKPVPLRLNHGHQKEGLGVEVGKPTGWNWGWTWLHYKCGWWQKSVFEKSCISFHPFGVSRLNVCLATKVFDYRSCHMYTWPSDCIFSLVMFLGKSIQYRKWSSIGWKLKPILVYIHFFQWKNFHLCVLFGHFAIDYEHLARWVL